MRSVASFLLVLAIAVGGLVFAHWKLRRPSVAVDVASVNEVALLDAATLKDRPRFPADSLRRASQGVAVARLTLSLAGEVTEVEILEVPDSDIAEELRQRLATWRFDPRKLVGDSGAVAIVGKLTFYFRMAGIAGTVMNSAEAAQAPIGLPAKAS
jgi:hypothetical protein